MTVVSFVVPGAPVPFARAGGNGKVRFTPGPQRNFMAIVRDYAERAMNGAPPLDVPVRLTIEAVYLRPPSMSKKKAAMTFWKASKPDVDNIAKIIKDACNQIVWTDDARVADLRVTKPFGPLAQVTVIVSTLGDAA